MSIDSEKTDEQAARVHTESKAGPPSAAGVLADASCDVDRTISHIHQLATQAAVGWKHKLFFDWKTYLPEIETLTENCLSQLENLIPADEVERTKLLTSITERRGKLPLETGITGEIVGICKQVLTFGAGGLALTLAFADKAQSFSVTVQKILAITGIFYLELVVVSLIVLILYLLQARFRFPFLYFSKIGNAWPWFYYASISRDVPRRSIQFGMARLKAVQLYAEDYLKFSERILKETTKDRIRAEIQQYFLLISYQGYVKQFSLRLASTFMYGFIGSTISAILLVMLTLMRWI
jgi:hypothetical protein